MGPADGEAGTVRGSCSRIPGRERNRFGVIGELYMCADKAPDSGKTDMTSEQTGAAAERRASPPVQGLELELQDHIGMQLRAVYDEVLNEPVPERFLKLLAELERKQAPKS